MGASNSNEHLEKKSNFNVISLGIIFDYEQKQVLIGRRENDPHFPDLSWVFPGGSIEKDQPIEKSVGEKIKKQTGLKVNVLGTTLSRIYPKDKNLLIIYFLCQNLSSKEVSPGGKLKELKWVLPEELENFFTTSIDPLLKNYLIDISNNSKKESNPK